MARRFLIVATITVVLGCSVGTAAAQVGAQTVRINAQAQSREVAQRAATSYAADAYIAASAGSAVLNEALRAARVAQTENARLRDRLGQTIRQKDQANASVAAAAAEVARLVSLIEASGTVEAALRLQIEAFAREAASLADTADPEELEALSRFADDPQEGEYLIIERINRARIAGNEAREEAVTAALRADTTKRLRLLVALKQQLLLVGRATVVDVIQILEEAQEIDPTDHWGWIQLARLYQTAGLRPRALDAAERARTNARSDWHRALALDEIGGLRLSGNDRIGALAAYQEGLAIVRLLSAANPTNVEAHRGVSASLDNVGRVLEISGKSAEALAAHRESLGIRRWLLALDATNAEFQREVSLSLGNIGRVLANGSDLPGALAAYEESLGIRRHLAATDPTNARAQRSLSVSLGSMGDVLAADNDWAKALPFYQESLDIARGLSAADVTSAEAQRDLSFTLARIGGLREEGNDPTGALAAFEESLGILRRLSAADPTNDEMQRDLGVVLFRTGSVRMSDNDRNGALAAFRESTGIRRRLAAADGANADAQMGLWESLVVACAASDQGACSELQTLSSVLAERNWISPAHAAVARSVLREAGYGE